MNCSLEIISFTNFIRFKIYKDSYKELSLINCNHFNNNSITNLLEIEYPTSQDNNGVA